MINLKKLHHNAYRCNNSENTRKFYEDFLELPLVDAFEISTTMTGRATKVLHTFYSLNDGSCLAFFEVANKTLKYKKWHDFDLHIALQVDENMLLKYYNEQQTEYTTTDKLTPIDIENYCSNDNFNFIINFKSIKKYNPDNDILQLLHKSVIDIIH